jgi:hypothetical protein
MKSTLLLLLLAMMGCKHQNPLTRPTLLVPGYSVTHTGARWWVTVPEKGDTVLRVDSTRGGMDCYLEGRNEEGFVVECMARGAK